MTRVLLVARAELLALVRTKFFLIGIISMPLLGVAVIAFFAYADRRIDLEDRRFAVIDQTGELYDRIELAAEAHNRETGDGARRVGPHFLPVRADTGTGSIDDLKVELSERIRRRQLFAFVEIPETATDLTPASAVAYYSENTSYQRLPSWLEDVLAREIEQKRFVRAGVDPRVVPALTARSELTTFGLVERRADGSVAPARRVDGAELVGVPLFFLVLMFMAVMSNAQHLINTIIEEKMSRISEVLLGSVTAFQLLMGKLLGVVVVSFLLAFVYLGFAIYAAVDFGRPDLIDLSLIGWFLVFLVCASLMFGALFQALSSACSDLKDAQSMLQPAMMLVVVVYLASLLVLRAPDSAFSVILSFVPPITPFAMLLRIAMPPGPPLWQVLLSVVVLALVTTATVWAAGRIFRVGLLMQGKPPNLPELIRWIRQ